MRIPFGKIEEGQLVCNIYDKKRDEEIKKMIGDKDNEKY
jgi:hypothetical protein